jgi:amidophosphoribosyltransferase
MMKLRETLQDLIDAVYKKGKSDIERFDCSVFNGEYVTGDVSKPYLEQLELLRNDGAKSESESTERSILDLHNDI